MSPGMRDEIGGLANVTYFSNFVVSLLKSCILESKGIGVIFQKEGKEMLKKGRIFEN